MDEKGVRFSVFCDLDGKVTQVIKDDDHFLPQTVIGSLIFSIVVPSDLDKIINFFLELKSKSTAIGWEINIATDCGAETFLFFGGVFNNQIGIAAATSKNGAQKLFNDFTRINNEQVNIIRTLSKENERLMSELDETPVSFYEELSKLNNDLVNMQRELAKKNRELDELNKLKNQFLGMAAHDLRSPLGIIMGYSEFLHEETANIISDEHKNMLNQIMKSSEFMLNLLNNLLDVSAIESGNLNLNLAKTDVVNLIKRNVELNNTIASKKQIIIRFIQHTEIPLILIDSEKIEQALNNLISNAIKYSPQKTEVTVLVTKNPKDVTISVKDNGQGIPEHEIEKLFKPFERTSVKSTGGEKSTGLGLSIVKKLIQGHRGKIWVESKVGEGSTFSFSLPIE